MAKVTRDFITVDGADLYGLLTDLERTASKDPLMFALGGILLHAYPEGGETGRLYATSTNRFLLGQAWEECQGGIGPCFVDLEAVTLMRTVLKNTRYPRPVTLASLGDLLEVSVPGIADISVPLRDYSFPDFSKIIASLSGPGAEAALAPRFVHSLAMIGKRRNQPMIFTFGQGKQPSTIDIGTRYRALIMPRNDPSPEPYRWSFPPKAGA